MAGQSSMAPGGGQAGCAGGDQALADREHVHQRVRLPAVALLLVGPATVEVRDDPAVDHDADRRTELAAFGEVGLEGVAQRLEPRVAVAFYPAGMSTCSLKRG